jgi:6-phosphogluconolactonase
MEKKLIVEVAPTAADLAHIAYKLIAGAAAASIGRRQFFRIALAGGSTPRAVYALLAADPYIDFRNWQIFWGDERCVPPTDPQSNYLMAKNALFDRLSNSSPLLFRMAGEGEPVAAAAAYERSVRELVPPNPAAGTGETPRFDLILLGMGADGHTASLFPGQPVLTETKRLVAATTAPSGQPRLTFTYPLINAARRVLILVSGAEKAATLHAVRQGSHDPARYPVQGVELIKGNLTWLVDAEARGE